MINRGANSPWSSCQTVQTEGSRPSGVVNGPCTSKRGPNPVSFMPVDSDVPPAPAKGRTGVLTKVGFFNHPSVPHAIHCDDTQARRWKEAADDFDP